MNEYRNIKSEFGGEIMLKDEDIKGFHTKMWFYCHGIAILVNYNE